MNHKINFIAKNKCNKQITFFITVSTKTHLQNTQKPTMTDRKNQSYLKLLSSQ